MSPTDAGEAELLRGVVDDRVIEQADARAERMARVRWSVMTEPGDAIAGRLIAAFGAVAALQCALDSSASAPAHAGVSTVELARARERWLPRREDHRHPLLLARRAGARIVVPGDVEWPVRADDLGVHAPVALWVRGATGAPAHESPAVAIVGARAATAYGTHAAAELAGDLAGSGVTIVSGAAFGIDAAAHRATLAVGGRGLAVLAGGVEKAYPAGHAELLSLITARGAVMSEVPCGTAPTKWRFLQRKTGL